MVAYVRAIGTRSPCARCLSTIRQQVFYAVRRWYSSPSSRPLGASSSEVCVHVKIGLDKQVQLAVRQPPTPEQNAPIIIYLHPGIAQSMDLPSTSSLAMGANAVVVRVEYDVSTKQRYPSPIHSVLAGYDWIRENLLLQKPGPEGLRPPKIGVCGEIVGGSLAMMLALTECHRRAEGGIGAVAVGDPILDWSALVEPGKEVPTNSKRKKKSMIPTKAASDRPSPNDPISICRLLDLRRRYFARPEKYFDPFASPLLFFRTPEYALVDTTRSAFSSRYQSHITASDEPLSDEEPFEAPLIKKRLAYRAYPPMSADLLFPTTSIHINEGSVLRDQGHEMVRLMRRSAIKGQDTMEDDVDEENRFTVQNRSQHGLWDDKALLEVGRWLGEALRRPP